METVSDKLELWGGIECSVNRVGEQYFDQLEYSGHYGRPGDISKISGLGIKTLRYPILWEKHQPAPDRPINWSITSDKLLEIRSAGMEVIAGLVHHGSGPTFVEIEEDSFVTGLAEYAGKVAEQYPWVKYYTPVNEPVTTARFCGLYGIWYPHEKGSASFCRILINECKATVLAMQAIRRVNPRAKLVQTEDLGKTHSTPTLKYQADFENHRRWLSFDLLSGLVNNRHPLWEYLLESGITIDDLKFFLENKCPPDIMGINHYLTSERYLDEKVKRYPAHLRGGNGRHLYADIEAVRVGDICPDGPYKLLKEAWKRYNIPLVVTETHLHCSREEQMRWLALMWHSALKLIREGVNIHAVTAWALFGSFGWSELLTRQPGQYEAGAFDLSTGVIRPTVMARMITSYNSSGNFIHPVLANAGWWQRKCRALYGKDAFYTDTLKDVGIQPVLIIGHANGPVVETCIAVCNLRGIGYVCFDHTHKNDLKLLETVIKYLSPWAVINTDSLNKLWTGAKVPAQHFDDRSNRSLNEICENHKALLLTFQVPIKYSESDAVKVEPAMPHAGYTNALQIKVKDATIGELTDIYNASLDLLLDGEKGLWETAFQNIKGIELKPAKGENKFADKIITESPFQPDQEIITQVAPSILELLELCAS